MVTLRRGCFALGLLLSVAVQAQEGAAEARLVSVERVDSLVVEVAGRRDWVRVAGISGGNRCFEASARYWLSQILRPGMQIHLTGAGAARDPAGSLPARVWIPWGGQWMDLGHAALRTGQASYYPAADPVLAKEYPLAEDEARAESAGLWSVCASPLEAFRGTAQATGFPPEILYGIAMNESQYRGRPWPWTLNVGGRGYYFKDRHSAWKAAEWLLARGNRMFDIGVMQINWRWHGTRFKSTWEALQPETNRRVAAAILAENLKRKGSLSGAIGQYHSSDPARAERYVQKFMRHYEGVRRDAKK